MRSEGNEGNHPLLQGRKHSPTDTSTPSSPLSTSSVIRMLAAPTPHPARCQPATSPWAASSGVPQGCQHSPSFIIFIIFIIYYCWHSEEALGGSGKEPGAAFTPTSQSPFDTSSLCPS